MATLKHKLRVFYGVYYSNYFMRGASRFSTLATLLVSFMTFLAVWIGKDNALFFPILIAIAIIGFVFFMLFGMFDYSSKGGRILETKTYWEADFGLKPSVEQFNMQYEIAKKLGIEPSQEWLNTWEWLKAIDKKQKFNEMIEDDIKNKK